MNLEGIMLSEICQTEKKIQSPIEYNKKETDPDTENKLVDYQWGEEKGGRQDRWRGLKHRNYYVLKISHMDILYSTGNIASIL